MTAPAGGRLVGRCIALPEHRELDRLAAMLEAEGAHTYRCPLMAILEAPDPAPIAQWLGALVAGRFDDVVFLTGEGVVRLMTLAEKLNIDNDVKAALARVRKITRGPKPARALHAIGLGVDIPSIAPTSTGVVDSLRGFSLAGRQIGVQLYGDDPNAELVGFLEMKGAQVFPVAPYRYAPALDDARVFDLITRLANHEIDAIAFTAAMQIDRLFEVARKHGAETSLNESLAQVHVAAVGPIVSEALTRRGVRVDVVPARQFFMRRLTQTMADVLGPRTSART
ncbi:MAG TPA: uroporphyrinogen-III synthase [Polyangia bacterium]